MLKVKNVDSKNGTALVETKQGKIFPVTLQKWLRHLVSDKDLCKVTKSKVTGEWIMTDYICMR